MPTNMSTTTKATTPRITTRNNPRRQGRQKGVDSAQDRPLWCFGGLTKTAPTDIIEAMNDYELSKLADQMDEDAFDLADMDLNELLGETPDKQDFKSKYLTFYDDIKTSPYDDW